MELQLLNKDGLTAVYQNEMVADFPKAELKPLSAMLRLMDLGRYDPLAAIDGGETVGYAMMWLPQDRTGALLEYLGVLRGRRNGGLGGQILELLAARYGQLFGEAEAPGPDASPEENDLRRRRIAFYQRNGFGVSHVVKDFFTKNYPEPIYDAGVLCRDMVYLCKINSRP